MNRLFLIAYTILTVSACSSINSEPPLSTDEMVWSSHDKRPDWTLNGYETTDLGRYFTGLSDFYSSERIAKDASYLDAITNASKYFIQTVSESSTLQTDGHDSSSRTVDPEITYQQNKALQSYFTMTKVTPVDYYLEQYEGASGHFFYKAYTRIFFSEDNVRASEKRAKALLLGSTSTKL